MESKLKPVKNGLSGPAEIINGLSEIRAAQYPELYLTAKSERLRAIARKAAVETP